MKQTLTMLVMFLASQLVSAQTFTVNNLTIQGQTTATNSIAPVAIRNQAANTVLANPTGASGPVVATPVAGCSTTSSALQWTSGTGFTCGTSINAVTLGGATFASPGPIGSGTQSTGRFSTLTATGAITPSTTSGIVGTTAGDNANAGSVGEYLSTSTLGTSLTNNTNANVTSLALTAGDYDCTGQVIYKPAGTTTVAALTEGLSTVSATPTVGWISSISVSGLTTGAIQRRSLQSFRVSSATPVTVYAVAQATFAVSTMVADGYINCRRER